MNCSSDNRSRTFTVRDATTAGLSEQLVATGVIWMQCVLITKPDRTLGNASDRLDYPGCKRRQAVVDHHDSVGAVPDADVAVPAAHQHVQSGAQALARNLDAVVGRTQFLLRLRGLRACSGGQTLWAGPASCVRCFLSRSSFLVVRRGSIGLPVV